MRRQCYSQWQQFTDAVNRPVCNDIKHVMNVVFWIYSIQFARPDKNVQQRTAFTSVI